MPINELEQHPYLNYYKAFENQITKDYYKGIIIGSFPIYAITDSINAAQEIIAQQFNTEASMRFFYGSKKSDLWKYLGLALGEKDPRKNENGMFLEPHLAVENCGKLLFQNRLLISDSLYRLNRTKQGAEDSGLMVQSDTNYVNELKSVNFGLKEQLRENTRINNIYFTSTSLNLKSPFGWFIKIFSNNIQIGNHFTVGVRTWSATATIDYGEGDVRQYNLFFLPTPKPRGIHWGLTRTIMFENFLASAHPVFYHEIDAIPAAMLTQNQKNQVSIFRAIFLIACYRQAIVYNNVNFDGSNAIV